VRVELSQIPCWKHLTPEVYRTRLNDQVGGLPTSVVLATTAVVGYSTVVVCKTTKSLLADLGRQTPPNSAPRILQPSRPSIRRGSAARSFFYRDRASQESEVEAVPGGLSP